MANLDFEILSQIGKGTGGIVYLTRQISTGEFKAVKELEVDVKRKTRTKESLQKEASILSNLTHPHIVRFVDSFFKDETHFCIVQEYCDGGTLADQIDTARESKNLISETLLWKWLLQILLALHYLHNEKQVIHRDLKAANVFLLKGRTIKLGDFGIAKSLSDVEIATTCVGTPAYLSPELVQDIPYSYASDMWALGCLMFELLTLRRAFDANNLLSLFNKISRGERNGVMDVNEVYSSKLKRIIDGLLTVDPESRFSATQLLQDDELKNHLFEFIDEKETSKLKLGEIKAVGKTSNISNTKEQRTSTIVKEQAWDLHVPFSHLGINNDTISDHKPQNSDLVIFGERIVNTDEEKDILETCYEDDFEDDCEYDYEEEEWDEEEKDPEGFDHLDEDRDWEAKFRNGELDNNEEYEDDFDEFDSSDDEILENAKHVLNVYRNNEFCQQSLK